jgi:hypothetical protein
MTLTDGATITWDVIDSPVAKVTLAGNRTLSAPSGTTPIAGQFVSSTYYSRWNWWQEL